MSGKSISKVTNEKELEELLSRPSADDVRAAKSVSGDVLILGAGGKIGPTLVKLICRSLDEAKNKKTKVFTVSRGDLAIEGAQHIKMDLLEAGAVERLPDAKNVFYLAAKTFRSTDKADEVWTTNVFLPGLIANKFKKSQVVAFSTGNVYPLMLVSSGGATEKTIPEPVGEYSWTALGRERMFEDVARRFGTKISLLRLNYSVELRYGVLVDIALKVINEEPIDLKMGYVNVIWQGYVNSVCFRSLFHASSPPFIVNITGEEILPVRVVAEKFGKLLNRPPKFIGEEEKTALLSDASRCHKIFGRPKIDGEALIKMVAGWIYNGSRLLNKPTNFQILGGKH